jgi:arsenite transporter
MSETAVAPAMGAFERFLTLWVALCIVAGIALGQIVPGVFHALGEATVAEVNLPVAVLVWLMIVPMLLKIDLGALGQVRDHWRGTVLHGAAGVDLHCASVPAAAARRPDR